MHALCGVLLMRPVLPFAGLTDGRLPESNLKVAFIGDASEPGARAVLELIKSEGADMVIHSGDLDYELGPDAFDARINEILGADFPYFASIGNHDAPDWPDYHRMLTARLARIHGARCKGNYGIQCSCTYRGLFFILSGVGVTGSGHEGYIRDELGRDQHIWSVCSWHRTQTSMQVGTKSDGPGWGAYEECIRGGAIIATAHEHSYARTRTLTSAEHQTVDPSCSGPDDLCVGPGRSFVFQAGLGGRSIRYQERCLPTTFPYGCNHEWAKIYTASQDATYGALFITFGVDGDPYKARGYFKNIRGDVIDRFTIHATPAAGGTTPPPAPHGK